MKETRDARHALVALTAAIERFDMKRAHDMVPVLAAAVANLGVALEKIDGTSFGAKDATRVASLTRAAKKTTAQEFTRAFSRSSDAFLRLFNAVETAADRGGGAP